MPRDLKRLDPPAPVREIVARLERAGFETWAVGGAVRDALLGQEHLDWDLATAATPKDIQRTFKRTVPVGIEFGTVGVLDEHGTLHEVTTFRHDVKTDGRHAVVEFGASLDEDLARRDFTVNAIAYHPQREEFRDPFDGKLDLQRGLVRAVGDADTRMREDRLRALRAIRFASRFTFHIEPATWQAVVASAPHLTRLSPERVKQELEKTMQQVPLPSIALEWWRESGALGTLIPALADAPAERFEAIDQLPLVKGPESVGRTLDRLSLLFFGGDPKAAAHTTKALRFSNADAAWIGAMCEQRAASGEAMDASIRDGRPNDATVRRWVANIGRTKTPTFFTLWAALWRARLSQAPDAALGDRVDEVVTRASTIAYRDPISLDDLALDGDDLRAAGVAPGPEMGKSLKRLLDAVVADPSLNTRDALMRLLNEE
jgi:tRNA nucleotidyltransferase (CCA-adding enzyme)